VRVLIAGGGTGGHIMPALAIADALQKQYQAELLFVGTARGLESRLVPQAGHRLELIKVGQLKNVSFVTRLRTMLDLPMGVFHCRTLLKQFRPDVVIGVGYTPVIATLYTIADLVNLVALALTYLAVAGKERY